jgi:hypothetical protein
MSKKAILDSNEASRRLTIYAEEDGKTFVETRQDCEHIIRAASIIADQAPGKDFRHAAFIPEIVLNQAMLEGWFHDKAAWKRWANDPANEQFRTWKGRM